MCLRSPELIRPAIIVPVGQMWTQDRWSDLIRRLSHYFSADVFSLCLIVIYSSLLFSNACIYKKLSSCYISSQVFVCTPTQRMQNTHTRTQFTVASLQALNAVFLVGVLARSALSDSGKAWEQQDKPESLGLNFSLIIGPAGHWCRRRESEPGFGPQTVL